MNKIIQRFGGKFVSIIMKNVKGAQVLSDSLVAEGNVIIECYLLDEDEEFYYTGASDVEIDEALRKDDVVRIFTPKEEDKFAKYVIVDSDDDGKDRH